MFIMPLCVCISRNWQAVSRLWRLNNRFVLIQAVFYMEQHCSGVWKAPKRSFNMDKDRVEFEELEKACREVIRRVLLTCESELLKHNDELKPLPSAAIAVKESILTFLALVNPE
jgi:hypothetical protein